MDGDKVLRKRKPGIALLAGFFLFAFVLIAFLPSGFADDDGDIADVNIIALHDSSSGQYEKHCLDCHADVLAQQSLDPSIPTVHVAMIPLVPGEEDEDGCAWCHRSVDLVQGVQRSNGTLRKHVDADLCRLCHGPAGPGKKFYQTDINPDGPALYELVCAACHGDLADSEVQGESAREIREKIDENEGGMGPLNVLSTDDVRAIADALVRPEGGGD